MRPHILAPLALLTALSTGLAGCDIDSPDEQEQLRQGQLSFVPDLTVDLAGLAPGDAVHIHPGDYVLMGDRGTYAGISQDATMIPEAGPTHVLKFGTRVVAHTTTGIFQATYVGLTPDGLAIFSSSAGQTAADEVQAFAAPIVVALIGLGVGIVSCFGKELACALSCDDRFKDCDGDASNTAEADCCRRKLHSCLLQCKFSCGTQGDSVDFDRCLDGTVDGGIGEVMPFQMTPHAQLGVAVILHDGIQVGCEYSGSAGFDDLGQPVLGEGQLRHCRPL